MHIKILPIRNCIFSLQKLTIFWWDLLKVDVTSDKGGSSGGGGGATKSISESLFKPFNFLTDMFPFSWVSRILKWRLDNKLVLSLFTEFEEISLGLDSASASLFFSCSSASFFILIFLKTVPIADFLLIVLPNIDDPILQKCFKFI